MVIVAVPLVLAASDTTVVFSAKPVAIPWHAKGNLAAPLPTKCGALRQPQRGSYSRRPVGAPNALRRFSSGRLINRSSTSV